VANNVTNILHAPVEHVEMIIHVNENGGKKRKIYPLGGFKRGGS